MYGQQSAFPYAANPMAPYGQNRYSQFQPSFTARPQRPFINPLQIEVYQVTNPDEAKAQLVNPVSPTLFCNFGQNEIYVKHIDNNG